jgi:hypothetical protein
MGAPLRIPPQTLEGGYRAKYHWWEAAVTMRRMAVAYVATHPQGQHSKALGLLSIFLFSLLMHMWARPFKYPIDQLQETLCLMSLTFVAGTLYTSRAVFADLSLAWLQNRTRLAMEAATLIAAALPFAFAAFVLGEQRCLERLMDLAEAAVKAIPHSLA